MLGECPPHLLAVYDLTLTTMWSPHTFPRQYPQWRPPAQWSKLIGLWFRVQNCTELYCCRLFPQPRIPSVPCWSAFKYTGTTLQYSIVHYSTIKYTVQVQQFVEKASTEGLDKIPQAKPVLDLFLAPPIEKGVGQSKTTLMVDGKHSMISFISKIIPSPDWFIGLDGLDLCKNGSWSPLVEMEVDLLDGGTDNGFTFTSPNYPTLPPSPVQKITNILPDHPAGKHIYGQKISRQA